MVASTISSPVASLSRAEAIELARLEGIIRRGRAAYLEVSQRLEGISAGRFSAYLEVSRALEKIRRDGLYRTHKNFQTYCKQTFGFGSARAYSLMRAGRLAKEHQRKGLPVPANERQARIILERRRQANGAPKPPRRDAGECNEDPTGKLIVAKVYQVQRIRKTRAGELVHDRVSDWPTEQEAEAEVRRLLGMGQAENKPGLGPDLESTD